VIALVLGLAAVVLALVALGLGANLVAHVSRYRRHRQSYPKAPRGRVWKATR